MKIPPKVVLNLRNGNNINDIVTALQRISPAGVSDKTTTAQQDSKGTFEKLGDVVYGMFGDSGEVVGIENGRLFVLFTNTPLVEKGQIDGSVKDVTAMRSRLAEYNVNTLLVDFGQNNVGKIKEVSGGDEGSSGSSDDDDDVFLKVVSVRRDDVYSLLPDIVDNIAKAKKDNSKLSIFLIFLFSNVIFLFVFIFNAL